MPLEILPPCSTGFHPSFPPCTRRTKFLPVSLVWVSSGRTSMRYLRNFRKKSRSCVWRYRMRRVISAVMRSRVNWVTRSLFWSTLRVSWNSTASRRLKARTENSGPGSNTLNRR